MRPPVVLCAVLLLAACTSTHNILDSPPVKTCSVPGFMCYVISSNPRDVGLSLQNNLGTDLSSVSVTLTTKDCVLDHVTDNIGPMPTDAITPAHFNCADPIPSVFNGVLRVSYTTNKGTSGQTVNGTIRVKS